MTALLAAKPLGISLDAAPLGVERRRDVSVSKLGLPGRIKQGQTFEVKILVQAAEAGAATLRLYRNDQPLGEQKVELAPGKNLFTFPQTLEDPGFYNYTVQVEAPGDLVPQNNRAGNFIQIRGNPRVLIVSAQPEADQPLATALRAARLETQLRGVDRFPGTLGDSAKLRYGVYQQPGRG